MYRPSVQAVPGAKVLRRRPVAPMAQCAAPSVQDVLNALNARNAVSRPRSSSRPNAESARGVRHRHPRRRWTAVVEPRADQTTRHGG
ncbi:hypothetical protein [Amycolatopsis sp. BJA-103]|uniref:hypothetical protein n=1 Tax=Amycolatopsis sp. BJA-103 TaxID=1911175 RepID=UPI000C791B70|nr:hypothetical protein [Amycolatopsis sp. BJA-103]AUI62663.1 hypothetical protein BKN51_33915 [Amycolatopsis sp. BJA-103]PNE18501.1 hypothetical protein B1H26_11600 [Amycolatopsis sp. BJA-103]